MQVSVSELKTNIGKFIDLAQIQDMNVMFRSTQKEARFFQETFSVVIAEQE